MKEYHKIQSVFLRDEKNNFKSFLYGEFSRPEFKYLADSPWDFSEKVDGTNIRISFDGIGYQVGGRTDNAQIPVPLLYRLQEIFQVEKMKEVFKSDNVILFGEGYGAKIQKGGGNYIRDRVDFVLFDIQINNIFLLREDVNSIAEKLNIKSVPILRQGSLWEAIDMVKSGFQSTWGDFQAEGLVLRPTVELLDRQGARIIAKIKCRDFK